MPTPQKEAIVQELSEKFREAKSLVLADYRGLDVESISELRRLCREEHVQFRVAKNTLSRLAMAEMGLTDLGELLEGPTGVAIAREDELAAARVLVDFAKKNDKLEVKGGVLEGRVYSLDEIKALATLPPKDQLIGMLLASMESPVAQVISAAQSLLQDVFSCAEQSVEGKGSAPAAEAEAAAAAEDAPAAGNDEAAGDGGDDTPAETAEGGEAAAGSDEQPAGEAEASEEPKEG